MVVTLAVYKIVL